MSFTEAELFETRTMLAALETRKPPRTFLRDKFFSTVETFDTEHVDIDIIKGKRKMAPFVSPMHEGKLIERAGFKTRTFKPAYIKPKMVTTAQDVFKRTPGETIYQGAKTPAQRAAEILGKDLANLDDQIIRREEWMAAQLLTSGKVRCVGEGIDVLIDFLMEATHLPVLSGTALWSDHANSTPLTNLRTWKRLLGQDSGINPTDVIMSTDVYDHFLLNTKEVSGVGKLFDMNRILLGQIEPKDMGNGVSYIGRITEIGVDLWTYEEWYVDENDKDTEKPMIPSGKLIMTNPIIRTSRSYGAIKDLKSLAAVPRFPKSWEEEDPSVRFLLLQSAPLPQLQEVDGVLCATVL
jgi:hypothetical protein